MLAFASLALNYHVGITGGLDQSLSGNIKGFCRPTKIRAQCYISDFCNADSDLLGWLLWNKREFLASNWNVKDAACIIKCWRFEGFWRWDSWSRWWWDQSFQGRGGERGGAGGVRELARGPAGRGRDEGAMEAPSSLLLPPCLPPASLEHGLSDEPIWSPCCSRRSPTLSPHWLTAPPGLLLLHGISFDNL